MFYLTVNETFDKEIGNDNFRGKPKIEIIRMIEENNIVVAQCSVQCKIKAVGLLDNLFCDVFQIKSGKIKQRTTYQMNK